jgi:DNA-binding beta-propeller fold protein YncE
MDGPQLQSNPRVGKPTPLKSVGVIEIPNARDSDFDHAAFDPKTRRVFIAHIARDCVEVIDHDTQRHIATLPSFPGVAGAVADDGEDLTTNRGAATITWLEAAACRIKAVFPSGRGPTAPRSSSARRSA